MLKIDAAKKLKDLINCFTADAYVGLSLAMQSFINFLDNAVNLFFSRTALEALSNS